MSSASLRGDLSRPAQVLLYWLPLGAGGRSVRVNGMVYEALVARLEHRPAQDLYHSALEVFTEEERYVIEMAPVWSGPAEDRGVAQEGPVGTRWLGRSALFRYEVRCWRNGCIPDVAEAVESPIPLSQDAAMTARLLDLVPHVPALVWGRDELRTGEMWNCNSIVAWLLVQSHHDVASIRPPAHGRVPGWQAGLQAAHRGSAATGGPGGPLIRPGRRSRYSRARPSYPPRGSPRPNNRPTVGATSTVRAAALELPRRTSGCPPPTKKGIGSVAG